MRPGRLLPLVACLLGLGILVVQAQDNRLRKNYETPEGAYRSLADFEPPKTAPEELAFRYFAPSENPGDVSPEFKNVQRLFLDAPSFLSNMAFMTQSLGVQCSYCHDLGDFALDTVPAKQRAREMIQLVQQVNAGQKEGGVNCFTCHQGKAIVAAAAAPAAEPEPAPAAAPEAAAVAERSVEIEEQDAAARGEVADAVVASPAVQLASAQPEVEEPVAEEQDVGARDEVTDAAVKSPDLQVASAQPEEETPVDAAGATGEVAVPAGRDLYVTHGCQVCHDNNVAGAPTPGSREHWGPRLEARGRVGLYNSALNGIAGTVMVARGGRGEAVTDEELRAIVDYMLEGVSP